VTDRYSAHTAYTARRQRTCGTCDGAIPKGARYWRHTWFPGGDVRRFDATPECESCAAKRGDPVPERGYR